MSKKEKHNYYMQGFVEGIQLMTITYLEEGE